MSLELKEVRSKKKKSYDELLAEYKDLFKKTADVYIPELFEALHEMHPTWNNQDLEARMVRDLEGINTPKTIHGFRANFMKNPALVERSKKSRATQLSRQENLREEGREVLSKAARELPEPELQEEDEQTATVEGIPLEDWREEHPQTELSPFEALGEINRSIAKLWKALTGLNEMPTISDDVKKDFIKPTKQRREDIINGSSKIERTYLYNWIEWLDMALRDTQQILDKSDVTAYDRSA